MSETHLTVSVNQQSPERLPLAGNTEPAVTAEASQFPLRPYSHSSFTLFTSVTYAGEAARGVLRESDLLDADVRAQVPPPASICSVPNSLSLWRISSGRSMGFLRSGLTNYD